MPRDDLRRLARLWGVVLEDSVLETPTGCVAFGRRGEDCVVLKIPRPENDETHSLAALLHFAGSGAVRVLEHGPGAMLLERAIPGRPLTDLVIASCDDEATGIICDLIAALHRPALPADAVNQFPSIEDWGSELKSYRNDAGAIPFNLLDRAVALFAELASSQGPRRLLHGDLHHHNILYDQHRGWVAIDPKGVVGESPYEIGSALRNPTQDPARFAVASIIERRIAVVGERLQFDRDRVLAWAFAQAVLSAIWCIQDGRDPSRGLATAHAILPLL